VNGELKNWHLVTGRALRDQDIKKPIPCRSVCRLTGVPVPWNLTVRPFGNKLTVSEF